MNKIFVYEYFIINDDEVLVVRENINVRICF